MDNPSLLYGWITPESLTTIVVAAVAVLAGSIQLNRTFRLNKKSVVFDELSKDISIAIVAINSINTETKELVDSLAREANAASYDPTSHDQSENEAEVQRRLSGLDDLQAKHVQHITSIYNSQTRIIEIIRKIEKNTVVGKKPKSAARNLFYIAQEQHGLVTAANDVLLTFEVVPPISNLPNISSQTFNAFVSLYNQINEGNQPIRDFLENLEVDLHNDLVKGLFGPAKRAEIPNKYLTDKGIHDKRVSNPLL